MSMNGNGIRRRAAIANGPLAIVAAIAVGGSAYAFTPAPREEMEHVGTLSRMGPRSHAAFEAAISNGTITRNEMRIMRREAVRDLEDQEEGSSR